MSRVDKTFIILYLGIRQELNSCPGGCIGREILEVDDPVSWRADNMASSSLVGELGKLYEVWYNIEGNGGSALAINLPWPQSIYPPDGRLSLSPDAHTAGNSESAFSVRCPV